MSDTPDYEVQPAPISVEGAVSAHDLVIADLRREFAANPGMPLAVAAMEERKQYGLEKYGTVLHKDNGRDYPKDIDDEVGDLVAYLRIFVEKHPELEPVFRDDYRMLLSLVMKLRLSLPSMQRLNES